MLYNFQQFINEQENAQKVKFPIQILLRGVIGLTGKSEDFTKRLMKILYDKYLSVVFIKGSSSYNKDPRIPVSRQNKIDYSIPILNFTSKDHKFLGNKQSKVYNKLKDISLSSSKILFQKEFAKSKYVPKTVFSIDDIEELDLPIIAKPESGRSAMGIELFKTYEEARNSKLKFDIWSEAKDIDREFRLFVIDGKSIHLSERITNSVNDKSVGKKKAEDKIDLIYIDQNMKGDLMNNIEELKDSMDPKINLEFYNIDIILDKSGNLWVPEINAAPGIGPSMFYSIYKNYCKFAHNIDINEDCERELKSIRDEHIDLMKKEYKKEYKGSHNPI